jgi:rifampin ADP-ribosylating transferase
VAAGSTIQKVRVATGVTVSYVTHGDPAGAPVIFLHAWGESLRAFDRLIPSLPSTVHALVPDQRGHGEADKPEVGYALEDFAADIEAFMDALGLVSAALVGASSGGYVAQRLAVDSPDRVSTLVLVGSPRSLKGRTSLADERARLVDPVDDTWVRNSMQWFPRYRDVPDWYIDDRVRDGARVPAGVWRDSLIGLTTADPATETGTITAPILTIWGDRDETISFEEEQALSLAIPGSRLVVYENTATWFFGSSQTGLLKTCLTSSATRQSDAHNADVFVGKCLHGTANTYVDRRSAGEGDLGGHYCMTIQRSRSSPASRRGRRRIEVGRHDAPVVHAGRGQPHDGWAHHGWVLQPGPDLGGNLIGDHPSLGAPSAGKQDVDGHRAADQICCHHSRQCLDAGARWPVRHEATADHRLLVHRDIDDPPAAVPEHHRHHCARHQETADELGLYDVSESGRPDFPERLRVGHEPRIDRPHADARVVDEHVEAAPRVASPLDTGGD